MRKFPLSAALFAAAQVALAQSSPWYLSSALVVTHDSNLLRLGRTQPAPSGESKSDTLTSLSLVGGLDQPVGRQRVTGNLTLRDNRFDRNDKYDNQSYNGSLGLLWSSAGRLSGSLTGGVSRNLSTFNADGVGVLTSRNYETTQGVNASLSLGVVTEWTLEATGGRREVRNSLDTAIVRSRDYDQNDGSLGLAWQPSGALKLSAAVREVHGAFPRFYTDPTVDQADLFKQRQLEWGFVLQPSGASTVDLRLSSGRTRYRQDDSRDFRSTSGSLTWAWQPTGRVRLNTRYGRDDGRDNYPSTSVLNVACPLPGLPNRLCQFVVPIAITDRRAIDSLRVQLDWDVAAKVAISSSAQYNHRDVDRQFLYLSGAPANEPQFGIDNTTILTLSARWNPWRTTLLGCDLRREERRAGGTVTTGLQGTSFSCYGQFTLQ
jgi:hypothetical protein